MRSGSIILQATACYAAVLLPRQNAPKSKGLGPYGLDLTKLQGFDLARLGPTLKMIQPYFANMANSGMIANLANAYIPTLQLHNQAMLEPEIRKSAKRAKARLGPVTLVGKGVGTYHHDSAM
jgi:hypothetical protein